MAQNLSFSAIVFGLGGDVDDINLLAHLINQATPEQQAEAMTRLTPEQEEIARRFEDAGK